jgi:hypothetical protein
VIPHRLVFRDLAPIVGDGDVDRDESLDLVATSLLEDNPVLERSRLVTRGFQHARIFTWVCADERSSVVSITVTEFESAAQATMSNREVVETLTAADGVITPRASGTLAAFTDPDDPLQIVTGSVGAIQFVVVGTGDITRPQLEAIVEGQRQLLQL